LRRLAVCLALLGFAVSCEIPRDPDGTLERVSRGTLRVGITENDPWVIVNGDPTGVEVTLVDGFARQLGGEIEWVDGNEADLIGALEFRELDLVIGGITSDTPWAQQAAITAQYHEVVLLVAVPKGDDPPEDIDGLEVVVEANTEAAGLVEDKGAVPKRVQEIESVEGPVAVEDYLLEKLGAKSTGQVLARYKHVMAAPPGENAFLVRLERYLRSRRSEISGLLQDFSSD
jgi:polar amino acid transport system substrate-binding protein